MKKIILFLAVISLFSCSSGDENIDEAPTEFAMTAKINGDVFEGNNFFGDNSASDFTYNPYSTEYFENLEGFGSYARIIIWLKMSDLAVGTYFVDEDTLMTGVSHAIEMYHFNNNYEERTISGTIVIDEVDTSNNRVKGTFEFTVLGEAFGLGSITYKVSEGRFDYVY